MEQQHPNINNNIKVESSGQTAINFEDTVEQKESIEDIVNKLNDKYPYAKLSKSLFRLADNEKFIFRDTQIMSQEELEDYFKTESDLYDPDNKTEDERRYQ